MSNERQPPAVSGDLCAADEYPSHPTAHLSLPPAGTSATVLLSVGSFSPPTFAHLRLLVAARDSLRASRFVAGALLSPAADAYGKPGLAEARHRLSMCRLALADLPWAAVSAWEASHTSFVPTYILARHVRATLARWRPDVRFELVLVCGQDLRESMCDVKKWPPENVHRLRHEVALAVARRGESCKADGARGEEEEGREWGDLDVEPWVGDLSSTLVRYVSHCPGLAYVRPNPHGRPPVLGANS